MSQPNYELRTNDETFDIKSDKYWLTEWITEGHDQMRDYLANYNNFETFYNKWVAQGLAEVVEIKPVTQTDGLVEAA